MGSWLNSPESEYPEFRWLVSQAAYLLRPISCTGGCAEAHNPELLDPHCQFDFFLRLVVQRPFFNFFSALSVASAAVSSSGSVMPDSRGEATPGQFSFPMALP